LHSISGMATVFGQFCQAQPAAAAPIGGQAGIGSSCTQKQLSLAPKLKFGQRMPQYQRNEGIARECLQRRFQAGQPIGAEAWHNPKQRKGQRLSLVIGSLGKLVPKRSQPLPAFAGSPQLTTAFRRPRHDKGIPALIAVKLTPGTAKLIGIPRSVQQVKGKRTHQALRYTGRETLVLGQESGTAQCLQRVTRQSCSLQSKAERQRSAPCPWRQFGQMRQGSGGIPVVE
jgi:hypothetical protein